jgi:TPR repeat protein
MVLLMGWPIYLLAADLYQDQIRAVDLCTQLTEPIPSPARGIPGIVFEKIDSYKAVRACEKSRQTHPDDPHVIALLARAYAKAERYKEAFALAKKACEEKDLAGCTLLGGLHVYNRGKLPYRPKKAVLLYKWSCSRGDPLACTNLGILADRRKEKIFADGAKSSAKYLLESCRTLRYDPACIVYLNHMYFKTIPYDAALYEYAAYRACAGGDAGSCMLLEKHLEKTDDPAYEKKIAFAMKASCNRGNAEGCVRLGRLYANRGNDLVNNLLAYAMFKAGCEQGAIRFGCWYAGRYLFGTAQGIDKDIPTGLALLEKACNVGMNSFACYDLGRIYLEHPDLKEHKNKRSDARRVLERACELGNGWAIPYGCRHGIALCCRQQEKLKKRLQQQGDQKSPSE